MTSEESPDRNPLTGIGLKLLAVAIFMAMSSVIKATADEVPAGEAMFFRSLFAIPVIAVWLSRTQAFGAGLRTSNPFGHLWRGLMGAASMLCGFAGLGLLPLPEVTAISYAGPLLTVIFAAMFLGEDVRAFRLTAVTVGLAGVLIILSPRLGAFTTGGPQSAETLGAVLVLFAAVFTGLAQVFVRKLVMTERTTAIVFYFSVTSTAVSLVTLPFGWTLPSADAALLLIGAGLLGGVGQVCLTSSYRHADASVIAPFEYASIILALGIGYLVFDEVPTATMLAGAAVIVAAGIAIIWRERGLGIERARQRKSMTPQG